MPFQRPRSAETARKRCGTWRSGRARCGWWATPLDRRVFRWIARTGADPATITLAALRPALDRGRGGRRLGDGPDRRRALPPRPGRRRRSRIIDVGAARAAWQSEPGPCGSRARSTARSRAIDPARATSSSRIPVDGRTQRGHLRAGGVWVTTDAVAASLSTLAVAASQLGGRVRATTAFRIGVLTDCQGPFHGSRTRSCRARAAVPRTRRRLVGHRPRRWGQRDRGGGRRVELVRGCAETGELAVFIEEARRLLEKEHVDAIVGGNGPSIPRPRAAVSRRAVRDHVLGRAGGHACGAGRERLPLRARLCAAGGGPRGVRVPRARLAARSIVAGDQPSGWGGAAAFIAEFCSLEARIVTTVVPLAVHGPMHDRSRARSRAPTASPRSSTSSTRPARILELLASQARRPRDAAGLEPESRGSALLGARRNSTVSSGPRWLPATPPSSVLRDYRQRYAPRSQGCLRSSPTSRSVIGYCDAVEATLRALERVDGDGSYGRGWLRELRRSSGSTFRAARVSSIRTDRRFATAISRGSSSAAARRPSSPSGSCTASSRPSAGSSPRRRHPGPAGSRAACDAACLGAVSARALSRRSSR